MDTDTSTGRDGPLTLTEGVDLMAAFTTAAHARHDAEVAAVRTLGRLVRAGVVESLEGLPVDVHLAVAHRYTNAERAMLLDAVDVLAVMPATMRLWTDRSISWSQVRSLVAQVRRYGRDLRVALDRRIDASADLVELLDADRWEWTIAEAITDLLGPDTVERDEDAASRESFLVIQMGLFGRSRVYGELDAIDTATTVAGLDNRVAKDRAAPDPATSATRTRRGRRVTKARRRAKALVGLAADSLGGQRCTGNDDTCQGRTTKAKPLLVVHVPLDRITASASGLIDVAVPGWLPTLSGRLVDGLAADADIRAVLFDGARPLMVSRKLHAGDIPADTRLACQARDMGARDPAGRTPIGLSDLHHLGHHDHVPGDDHQRVHDPDRMVHLSPRGHHRIIHRHGWTGRIDTTDGRLTWSRGHRTITTLPWHTTLRRG